MSPLETKNKALWAAQTIAFRMPDPDNAKNQASIRMCLKVVDSLVKEKKVELGKMEKKLITTIKAIAKLDR